MKDASITHIHNGQPSIFLVYHWLFLHTNTRGNTARSSRRVRGGHFAAKREREREEEVIGGHLTKVNERTDVRSMFVFSSSSHIVSPLLFVTFGFFFPHIFDCFGSPIGVNTERSPHPNKLPDSHRGFSPENPLFFLNIIIMITAQPAPISQLDVYVKLTRTWEATLPVFSSSSSHIDYGNVQTFLFVLLSTLPKEKQQNKKLT